MTLLAKLVVVAVVILVLSLALRRSEARRTQPRNTKERTRQFNLADVGRDAGGLNARIVGGLYRQEALRELSARDGAA